jgi:hypothetical protein
MVASGTRRLQGEALPTLARRYDAIDSLWTFAVYRCFFRYGLELRSLGSEELQRRGLE